MAQNVAVPPRMIPGEVESVNVLATYVAGRGWSLTMTFRRQFQDWAEAERGYYEQLSTPELVTCIDAVMASTLKA
jgi:hypothetical protein